MVISSNPPCKNGNCQSTAVPLKSLLNKYELCINVKIKVLAHFLFLGSNGGTHGNNSFWIRKTLVLAIFFQEYCCKLDIVILRWRVTWNYGFRNSVPVNNLLHFTIFYLTISEIKMINTIIQYLITMITTILRLNTIFNKK